MRAVPTSRTWLVPDGVEMAEAASLPISFGTAHHCLFARAALAKSETVLIQAAAGGVGLAAVQLASEADATVIAVASGIESRGRLQEVGARHSIDRRTEDVVREVLRVTGNAGAHIVIDPVGTTLEASLAPEGRMGFVGNAGGRDLSADLWPAMLANQSPLGVFMGPLLKWPTVRRTINEMFKAVAARRSRVVIERVFPLAEAAAAHAFAESAKPLGRVVMKP
jgi:NADPH2:quinone reductase